MYRRDTQTYQERHQLKEVRRAYVRLHGKLDKEFTLKWFGYSERTGLPVAMPFSEWEWFAYCRGKKFIKEDTLGVSYISTVCLGIDSSFIFKREHTPFVFESARFIDGDAEENIRAQTLGEALTNHADLVEMVRREQAEAAEAAVVKGAEIPMVQ